MVSEDFLRFFPHYKSMKVNDPWGMANLDLSCIVGIIYVGDY